MTTINFFNPNQMPVLPHTIRRLMIFIDHSYVYRNTQDRDVRVNHRDLVNFLANDAVEQYSLQRVTLYGSIDRSVTPEKVRMQENTYRMFSRFPKFDIQIYDLKVNYNNKGEFAGKKEKCVDCALVTGLVKYACKGAFDTAIIVGGDEDFVPAVKEVVDQGLEVIIAAFEGACAEKLINQALGYISLTDNLDTFTEKKTYPTSSNTSPLNQPQKNPVRIAYNIP